MSTYRRILRGADNTNPYWVALEEEKCIGENFRTLRNFWEERGLSLSRHGHSVTVNFDSAFYQVFMFAAEEDAEVFRAQFGGERMHPSEKGKGTNWSQWKKGSVGFIVLTALLLYLDFGRVRLEHEDIGTG